MHAARQLTPLLREGVQSIDVSGHLRIWAGTACRAAARCG